MMTRQNFEAVANAIEAKMDASDPNDESNFFAGYARGIMDTAETLADVFVANNPRFDRERFLKACGVW